MQNRSNLQKQEDFAKCCNELGLEDGELTIAELVWRRAEKAMLPQKPNNGVLLGDSPNLEKILQDALVRGSRTYGARQSKAAMQAEKYALTESELQFLHSVLTEQFQGTLSLNLRLKLQAARYWKLSDKEDPETQPYYENFKFIQRRRQQVTTDLHRLQNAISKIKKMIRA